MKAIIYPVDHPLNGTIAAVSSKSLGHRAIICAGLSSGISTISNIQYSDDIYATIECLEKMGAKIERSDNSLRIKGIDGDFSNITDKYDANESGSTLRFLIPILAIANKKVSIEGAERLFERPLSIYEEIFTKNGLFFEKRRQKITFQGPLTEDEFKIVGNISSQFISGLLFALPLCKKTSKITIFEPFESKNYVLMTIDVLKKFGIQIEINNNEIIIPGNQKYCPSDYNVEGDYSQVANFMALGAIHGTATITNINNNSLQGDQIIVDYLQMMNVDVKKDDNYIIVKRKNEEKNESITLDIKTCPDLGPILMAMGAVLNKKTILNNTKRLAFKESDRGRAMQEEMKKFGIDVIVNENQIIVTSDVITAPIEPLSSHNDHRIFMACSVLATCVKEPVEIDNILCLQKSYPLFIEDLKTIGVKVVKVIPQKILIVGLGMIGGSYARALAKNGNIPYAIDIRNDAILYGEKEGFIKPFHEDQFREIDMVILCLYPNDNIAWLEENQNNLSPKCLITDSSGIKRSVVTKISSFLRDDLEFIASHPMAGRESSGVESSDDTIFKGANFIITPTSNNTKHAINTLKELASCLGFGNIEVLSIEEHDRIISYLSQLTHVIAVSLMNSHEPEKMIRYTGDSFRDLTRIAKINGELWSELFLNNCDYLCEDISLFVDELLRFKQLLKTENKKEIIKTLNASTTKRKLFDKT